jgi:hypothetical protein
VDTPTPPGGPAGETSGRKEAWTASVEEPPAQDIVVVDI